MSDDDPDTGATRYEWEQVIRRCRLGSPTKAVAFALATYADADGTRVRPGTKRLALVTETSERTVYRALGNLRDLGLIEQLYRGGHRGEDSVASAYRLTIPVDLIDRVEMLQPGDRAVPQPVRLAAWEGSNLPTGQVGRTPNLPDSHPNLTVETPQPDSHDTQPARQTPHHYVPATNQPTNQRDDHLEDVSTDRTRENLEQEWFSLNGGRR